MRTGTYYCGRVIKMGGMTSEMLAKSIENPIILHRGENAWTFSKQYSSAENGTHYVFANLCKFQPKGSVTKLNIEQRVPEEVQEENLIIAQSPFVYIPKYQGVAFLQVSNHIEVDIFRDKFRELAIGNNVLSDCQIEMIADLRTFTAKINALEVILRINVKVSPPNPLFSPVWADLKTYLEKRKSGNLKMDEKAKDDNGIQTEIKQLLAAYVDASKPPTNIKADISDAAILMAADGYGNGFVTGKNGEKTETVRTSKTMRNFDFEKDPNPKELFARALEIFEGINEERYLQH